METIRERLYQFLEYKELSQAKFEKAAGLSNGFTAKVGSYLRPDSLRKISECYPELDTAWLLTGVGQMLNCKGDVNASMGNNSVNNGVIGNGSVTNGIDPKHSEAKDKRDGQTMNKMLDMIADKIGLLESDSKSFINQLHSTLVERNQRIDKMFEMLDEKDRQLKEKDVQISRLMELLSSKLVD